MRIFIVFSNYLLFILFPSFYHTVTPLHLLFVIFFMLFPICMSSTLQENQFNGNGLNQLCMQFHHQRVMGGDWSALCSSMAARGHF